MKKDSHILETKFSLLLRAINECQIEPLHVLWRASEIHKLHWGQRPTLMTESLKHPSQAFT